MSDDMNRRAFLMALAPLVSRRPEMAAKQLVTMLPHLRDIPDSVFDDPGALAGKVADEVGTMPVLKTLRSALTKMVKRQRERESALVALPLPYDGEGLSDTDRSWCKGWQDRRESNRAERGVFLSCIRKFAPEGFKLLVRDDEIARDIAAKRGWLREPRTEPDPVPPSQDIRGKVTNAVAMPIASGAPRSPDPAHQRLIADQVQEHAGRPLGALSPEALEEARRRANSPLAGRTANGVPVPKAAPAEEPPPASPPTPEEQPFKFAWC
jgi:hypothetical protein